MSTKILVVASSNQGKVAEMRKILVANLSSNCQFKSLSDFDQFKTVSEPEENGVDYLSNAKIKAQHYFKELGFTFGDAFVIADDSGIECVDLDGYPGLISARIGDSDEHRRSVLLKVLKERLGDCEKYLARFVCYAVSYDGHNFRVGFGECSGEIQAEPKGSNGFGYDPIFYLPDGRTMAELEENEKNEISHRGIALRNLFEC